MTSRDVEVPEGLELMASLPVGVSAPHEVDAELERLLPGLEAGIAAFPESRARGISARRKRFAGVALAAVAVLSVGWFTANGLRGEGDGPRASTSPRSAAVERGAMLLEGKLASGSVEILPGSRLGLAKGLETGSGDGATLRADEGYELALGEGSAIRLLPGGVGRTELALSSGSVTLSVPKLPSGESLEVVTDDARVIVHGTKFRVALVETDTEGAAPRTCVEVTEGRVEVRRSGVTPVFLGAEERSGCAESRSEPAPSTKPAARSVPLARGPMHAERPRASTTLAEENALMTKALSAERANQRRAAARHYEELLTRYPESQFLPEARAGLARVGHRP